MGSRWKAIAMLAIGTQWCLSVHASAAVPLDTFPASGIPDGTPLYLHSDTGSVRHYALPFHINVHGSITDIETAFRLERWSSGYPWYIAVAPSTQQDHFSPMYQSPAICLYIGDDANPPCTPGDDSVLQGGAPIALHGLNWSLPPGDYFLYAFTYGDDGTTTWGTNASLVSDEFFTVFYGAIEDACGYSWVTLRDCGMAPLPTPAARILFAPAPSLSPQLTLSKSLVAGCKTVSGRVTLSSPAPAGGAIVTISDTLAAATPPAVVKFAEGVTSKYLTVSTAPVASNQSGTVTASLDGASSSQPLTVRPMGLSSVILRPNTVVGGNSSTGTATLECEAGPGPVTVNLSSTYPWIANPVAASIVVPQGLRSANFEVATSPVGVMSGTTISGSVNSVTKSKKLIVTVAALVSPTRLVFGNVPLGATSEALTANLYNKGAVPFSIDGITIVGVNAKYYTQTNDCPANLAGGASCTISVRFSPTSTGGKSARVSIATSAKFTPVTVSLSGTGI